MGKIEQVTIGLPVEAAVAIKKAVAAGQYASEADVLVAAVHLWAEEQDRISLSDDDLAALWDNGLASGQGPLGSIAAILVEAEKRSAQRES